MGQVLRNSENQELARWQDLSLCSLSLYLCFFLWVALFLLTPDDFPFLGGHHGLWQHLNFIYYNFVREKTDSTPKCQIKKIPGIDWIQPINSTRQSPVASEWGYMRPAGPGAHPFVCRGGDVSREGIIVSWADTPKKCELQYPGGLIWTWLWSYCVSPAIVGNRSRPGGMLKMYFLITKIFLYFGTCCIFSSLKNRHKMTMPDGNKMQCFFPPPPPAERIPKELLQIAGSLSRGGWR